MDAPTTTLGKIGYGLGGVAAVIAVGAVAGAVVRKPCAGTGTDMLFCGPGGGALLGGILGLLAAGVAGAAVAVVSPRWRGVGLTAAGSTASLLLISKFQANAASVAAAAGPQRLPGVKYQISGTVHPAGGDPQSILVGLLPNQFTDFDASVATVSLPNGDWSWSGTGTAKPNPQPMTDPRGPSVTLLSASPA